MDDFDIGIDPSSIDYSTADTSNADIANSIDGLGWEGYDPSIDTTQGWSPENSVDVGALTATLGGSPNVGSPSERDLRSAGAGGATSKAAAPTGSGKSFGSKIGDSLLYDKSGELDFNKLLKLGMGLGNLIGAKKSAGASNTADAARLAAITAEQLRQQQKGAWTPQQAQWANSYFQTPMNANRGTLSAADMKSPIVPGRGYAEGGGIGAVGDGRYGAPSAGALGSRPNEDIFNRTRRVREEGAGLRGPSEILQRGNVPRSSVEHVPIQDLLRSLPMLFKSLGFEDNAQPATGFAEGGDVMPADDAGPGALSQSAPFVGYVEGTDGGQSDLIDAKLSPGEYVWDADSVSAIGDGNNAAGAARLDQMREEIRAHKRSAPPDEIPPPMAAMNGGSV